MVVAQVYLMSFILNVLDIFVQFSGALRIIGGIFAVSGKAILF